MEVLQVYNTKHFATLFENVAIGVLVVNEEGLIEAANKYVLEEFGYTENDLLHKEVEMLLPERYRKKHRHMRSQYSYAPANIFIGPERNLCGLKKNGTEFRVEISLGYYTDCGVTRYAAFVNDVQKKSEAEETISKLKAELDQRVKETNRTLHATVDQLITQLRDNERKDAELIKALEKEKELNQLKSRFVSIASHEFRTPLSGILASTSLLSKYTKENEQPQRDKHIKRILSSVNLLNEVLGDFLSVDKMEQDNFRPNLTAFDLYEMVNETIQSLQPVLKEGQKIEYTQNEENVIAYLDHSMFQHILSNLLSNAIKYSPAGSEITLITEHKDQTLTLRVKDKGIGIPVKEQERLYQRFYRCSNSAQIQGTGLGLNIVKKYVDAMDGSISCISEENKGTEFIVQFNNQKEHY